MISDQAQEAQEVNCAVPRQHGYVRVTAQVKILLAAIHIDYIYLILPNDTSYGNKPYSPPPKKTKGVCPKNSLPCLC